MKIVRLLGNFFNFFENGASPTNVMKMIEDHTTSMKDLKTRKDRSNIHKLAKKKIANSKAFLKYSLGISIILIALLPLLAFTLYSYFSALAFVNTKGREVDQFLIISKIDNKQRFLFAGIGELVGSGGSSTIRGRPIVQELQKALSHDEIFQTIGSRYSKEDYLTIISNPSYNLCKFVVHPLSVQNCRQYIT